MKRLAARWLLGVLVAMCAACSGGVDEPGTVEYPDSPFAIVTKTSPRVDDAQLFVTVDQRAAYEAVQHGQYLRARQLAAALETADANSPVAQYVLARVQAFGDGNLPRGLFLVRKLRHQMEARGRADSGDTTSREWYLRALDVETDVLASLDRRDDQLRAIEVVERATATPTPERRIWPLIKLKRFDEARAAGRLALETNPSGEHARLTALNGLCATEFEAQQRIPCYEAAERMVAEFSTSAVLVANLGETAELVFRFDVAEASYARAAAMSYQDFHGTAYHYLGKLHVSQGRFADALASLSRAKAQRRRREAYTLQQDEALAASRSALLYLAVGRAHEALVAARRASETPDRAGSTSQEAELGQLACWLLQRAAAGARIEQLREEAGAHSIGQRLVGDGNDGELASLRLEVAVGERRLLRLLEPTRLTAALRPYLLGHVGAPSWLLGTLVSVLPPAVAQRAVADTRALESHPGAVPYFDACDAEIALRAGRDDAALAFAVRARAALPTPAEQLLRGRLAVVAGVAAGRLGRTEESRRHFAAALVEFPGAFRLLGVAIPVALDGDGTEAATRLVTALGASARLTRDRGGFAMAVRVEGDQLTVRLDRAGGAPLAVRVSIATATDPVIDALRGFHQVLAAGGIELPEKELLALEGSPLPSSTGPLPLPE